MPKSKVKKSLLSLVALAPLCTVILPACSDSGIVVANFESYMSQDLMDEMRREFNCQFLYYDTNETIETKFEKNYDIAIPSSYEAMILKKKGQLEKIDWSKFGMVARIGNLDVPVENSIQAAYLFSDSTQKVLSAQDELYFELGYLNEDEHILDYCIPYFLQSWMFAYKGDAIESLDGEDITWKDAAYEIGKNDRFKRDAKGVNIACIDDSRTMYGMSKLVYDQKNDVPQDEWNINPKTANESISQYEDVYDSFISNFNSDTFYFNSDSQAVLQTLADPNGSNGAFCYNGDALYALTGAGISDFEKVWNSDNFHAVMPNESVITIDMMVFNKKIDDRGEEYRQKVYDIAKRITLEGGSVDEDIAETDDEDNYIYGPMINFDFVMYTATLKNLDEYVTGAGGYIEEEIEEDQQELFTKMYNIYVPDEPSLAKNLFEQPLSDLDKSNMHWAYEPEKERL